MIEKNYLKNEIVYEIFPRNHSKSGDFQGVIDDLPRLVDLGITIIYLMPINKIGAEKRKGTLGSPYAIQDYYSINPEYGTLDDFHRLVEACHVAKIKVILDMVFSHTSPDSVLYNTHPELFFMKNGKPGNRVGDWYDIIDIDYTKKESQDYLLGVLKYWADQGIDGYRCDVAPLIPLSFWHHARKEVEKVHPGLIWLCESVEPNFIKWLRSQGHYAASDGEMYAAFDILYDYDIYPYLRNCLAGKSDLRKYLEKVRVQEYAYPDHYLKLHFLENHDQERIASYVKKDDVLYNLTAWSFFLNGVPFLYAGQECKATHKPSLFDKDTIDFTIKDQEFYNFIKRLIDIKKMPEFSSLMRFDLIPSYYLDIVIADFAKSNDDDKILGVFNFSGREKVVCIQDFPNGLYQDLITKDRMIIRDGMVRLSKPLFLKLLHTDIE